MITIMLFIAHRGFNIGVDENTFAAFNRSVSLKMDYIECDIQLSKDGVLYVLHDAKLNRTFNARGRLKRKREKYLNKIRSKNNNFSLPKFREVLDHFILSSEYNNHTKFMVELKGENTDHALDILLKKYPSEVKDMLVISGNKLHRLINFQKLNPEIPICLNITNCKQFPLIRLLSTNSEKELPLKIAMISLSSFRIHDNVFINKCKDLGITPLCWKFANQPNPIEKMKELINWGIEGILFDNPENVPIIRDFLSK